ncbi:small ubiquitin-related modifier 1 isoform X2 [Pipistrellus kuhlii]|uniref:small ubiquitin-related modifier 1 isoform X2 n=1 Tax=Pipistrellus kuhlii TaxID=59472 RepID=UPI001E274A73|nr:small ubiquitin-related modifier 1 isoform X2 [Pipistrellus kuhlii]
MEVSGLSLPKRAGGRGRGCQQTPNPEAGARTFPGVGGPELGGVGIRLWFTHSHAPGPQPEPSRRGAPTPPAPASPRLASSPARSLRGAEVTRGRAEVPAAAVLCCGEEGRVCKPRSEVLPTRGRCGAETPGEAPSPCLTRRQNLQLRTWGIRRKENTLNSKSLDSSEIHFKVKMTTHLKKLKESYCQRQIQIQAPSLFVRLRTSYVPCFPLRKMGILQCLPHEDEIR